jgi:hypothetical protein
MTASPESAENVCHSVDNMMTPGTRCRKAPPRTLSASQTGRILLCLASKTRGNLRQRPSGTRSIPSIPSRNFPLHSQGAPLVHHLTYQMRAPVYHVLGQTRPPVSHLVDQRQLPVPNLTDQLRPVSTRQTRCPVPVSICQVVAPVRSNLNLPQATSRETSYRSVPRTWNGDVSNWGLKNLFHLIGNSVNRGLGVVIKLQNIGPAYCLNSHYMMAHLVR